MANRFLNNIKINDSYTLPAADGTADQLITTDGAGQLSFIDPSTIAVGESEQVHIACKNTSGVAISKGDPVYITGTVGTSFIVQIAKADASNSAKMPAVGLAETDLAINAEGYVIVSGVLKNITTDPLSTGDGTPSSNDTVYVKVGGGLTRTKPTGASNLIQNVGKVGRVQGTSAGSLAVSTIMRTNDVPNLNTGKIWVGSSTYTTESSVVHLDESQGRMGINKTSLAHALDVSGTIATDSVFLAVATQPSLTFIDTNGGGEIFTSSGSMYFNTGVGSPTVKMTILSGGNVGIGDTTPSHKLDVNGNVNASRYYSNNNTTFFIDPAHSSNQAAILAGDVEIGWGSNSEYAIEIGQQRTGNGYAYLDLIGDETYQDYAIRLIRNNTGANATSQLIHRGTGNLEFRTWDAGAMLFSTTNSERMRITSAGNVGIGTTSPSVVGGTAKMTIDVGSGVTPVSIVNGTTDGMYIRRYTTGGSYQLQTTVGSANAGNLSLQSYGGNVGIGTTSPGAKTHIYGTAHTGTFADGCLIVQQSNTGDRMFIDGNDIDTADGILFLNDYSLNAVRLGGDLQIPNGDIGIGFTTAPTQRLHVDGNVRVTGAYYDSNNSAGTSGQVLSSTATGTDWVSLSEISGVDGTGTANYIAKWSDADTITNSIIYNNASGVGIGTTSINATLDILSTAVGADLNIDSSGTQARMNLNNTSTGDPQINFQLAGSSKFTIGVDNSDGDKFKISAGSTLGSSDRIVVDSSGNVGIGTTSPAYLVTANSSAPQIGCSVLGTSALRIAADGSQGYIFEPRNLPLTFSTNGSERMRIDSSGNVGIGGTPTHKLYVRNDVAATSDLDPTAIKLFNNSDGGSAIEFSNGVAGNSKLSFGVESTGAGTNDSYIGFSTSLNGATATERVRIDSSGNVGISSTDVQKNLSIGNSQGDGIQFNYDSTNAYRNQILNYWNSSTDSRMDFNIARTANATPETIMSVGYNSNVGIGTSSPASKFVVKGSGTSPIVYFGNGVDNAPNRQLAFSGGSSGLVWDLDATGASSVGGQLTLSTNGSERIRIDASGNVGIGTTSPSAPLEVDVTGNNTGLILTRDTGTNGELRVHFSNADINLNSIQGGFRFQNSGSERVIILPGGNVGIGTTSPSQKLEISDSSATTIRIDNTKNSSWTVGEELGKLEWYGNDASGEGPGVKGYIKLDSDNIYGAGFDMRFGTTDGTNGIAERMVITKAGSVGVGVTTPVAKLHIGNGDGGSLFYINGQYNDVAFNGSTSGTNGVWSFINSATWDQTRFYVQDANNFDSRLTFRFTGNNGANEILAGTSTGKVGIGVTNPAERLEVTGNIQATGSRTISAQYDSNHYMRLESNSSGGVLKGLDGGVTTTFVRSYGDSYFNGGNFGIGTTSPSYKLDVSGTIRATGDVIAYSDIRVKENIKTIDNALDKVKALRGVEYNKIDSKEKSIGVIAQEVEEVIPQVVKEDETGMKSVAYGNITAVLIEAIKEQQKQIDELKAIINGSA